MSHDAAELRTAWAELLAGCPKVQRLSVWFDRMISAAEDSRACGLDGQAERLLHRAAQELDRVRTRLDAEERDRPTLAVPEWHGALARDPAREAPRLASVLRRGRIPLVTRDRAVLGRWLDEVGRGNSGAEASTAVEEWRQRLLGRRLTALRAHREQRNLGDVYAEGVAVGPYNRRSALGDALERIRRTDALWVEEFLELEAGLRGLEAAFGIKPAEGKKPAK